jgi:hypothetical protein
MWTNKHVGLIDPMIIRIDDKARSCCNRIAGRDCYPNIDHSSEMTEIIRAARPSLANQIPVVG